MQSSPQRSRGFHFALLLAATLSCVRLSLAQWGIVDPAFAPTLPPRPGFIYFLAPTVDGRVLLSGTFEFVNGSPHPGLVRLLADGQVDTNFNSPFDPALNRFVQLTPDTNATALAFGSILDGAGVFRHGPFRLRADGSLDPGFNAPTNFLLGGGIALQQDGKILVGVSPPTGTTNTTPLIVRLNSDGTVDASYNSALVAPPCQRGFASALRSLPNNQLLALGNFPQESGLLAQGLVRLNGDGALDASFAVTNFAFISDLAAQPDGRILVSYADEPLGSQGEEGVARLLANGQLDASFNGPHGSNVSYFGLSPQSNGAAYVAMTIRTNAFGPAAAYYIVRMKADGAADDTFQPVILSNRFLGTYRARPDGRILAGLSDGTVVRLLSTGAVDPTFNADVESAPVVSSVNRMSNGSFVIGGLFDRVGSNQSPLIALLQSNGIPAPAFASPFGEADQVSRVVPQADGKLVIVGYFDADGAVVKRLNADGSIDTGFTNPFSPYVYVQDAARQPDGKLLVCGRFFETNTYFTTFVRRLNTDGSIDPGLVPPTNLTGSAGRVVVQPDGKILLSGGFSQTNGTGNLTLVRLTEDGALDPSFNNATSATNLSLDLLSLQSDGRILAARSQRITPASLIPPCVTPTNTPTDAFKSAQDAAAPLPAGVIFRLNTDGTFDSAFQTSLASNSAVVTAMSQPDGRILVGGRLYSATGAWLGSIVRLESNGQIDPLFAVPSELGAVVNSFAVGADGAIVLGGSFYSINGMSRSSVALVRPTGRSRLDIKNGLRLAGEFGRTYRVESSADLLNWTALTNVLATNATIPVNDPGAGASTNRFYRAVLVSP